MTLQLTLPSSDLDNFVTALDRSYHRGPYPRQASQENGPNRVANSDPHNSRPGAVERLQEDEILVLGNDARLGVAGMLPYRAVGHACHPEIADVVCLMPLGRQPSRERRRQVCVDKELHGSMAVRTG